MVEQLFDRNGTAEKITDDGRGIDSAMRDALKPLFQMWVEEGFSARDLRAIGFDVLNDLMLDSLLGILFNEKK